MIQINLIIPTIIFQKTEDEDMDTDLCEIPGLRSRVNNPLEFLGLYNTLHDACHRNHIPAKVVRVIAVHLTLANSPSSNLGNVLDFPDYESARVCL